MPGDEAAQPFRIFNLYRLPVGCDRILCQGLGCKDIIARCFPWLHFNKGNLISSQSNLQLNPDNSNLQGKSKKVRVIGVQVIKGKISKKITWRGIKKGSSYRGVRVIEGKISKKITWRGIEKGSS